MQIGKLQQDLAKAAEEGKSLTHTNKMKDRGRAGRRSWHVALSCLNQEINKMKLGSHYSSVI